MNKILIKNGTIIDGSGGESFPGNILISESKITAVGKLKDSPDYDQIIDAEGMFITPGFIDLHSHTDLQYFIDEGLKPKIMQGVTTEVIGQCGLGVAPIPSSKKEVWKNNLIIGRPDVNWNWESMEEYLYSLKEQGLESNLVPFVGHGTLRFAVKANRSGSLSKKELTEQIELADESFKAGVFGLSFGLIYNPALFSDRKELQSVIKVAADYKGLVAVHLRSEGDELIEALEEMIELTENSDCRLHISHLKAIGERNWSKIDRALELIAENDLTFDHYPYLAGSTTLMAIFPPFVFAGNGMEDTLKHLKDQPVRERIKRIFSGVEKLGKGLPWDNIPYLLDWEQIKISDLGSNNKEFIGISIREIAEIRGCSPADAAMDLIIEEEGRVQMIDFYLNETMFLKILQDKHGVIGTDTLLGAGTPHPRGYGSYPRLIHKYVLQKKALSLEEAVAKMTSRPAEILGLKNRGLIKPGMIADLNIFDSSFKDQATYQNPRAFPQGIYYVIINGKMKVKDGIYQQGLPGEVLRR